MCFSICCNKHHATWHCSKYHIHLSNDSLQLTKLPRSFLNNVVLKQVVNVPSPLLVGLECLGPHHIARAVILHLAHTYSSAQHLLISYMSTLLSFCFSVGFTYHPCHLVKRETLMTADSNSLIVMLPWGKDEQLTSRTGFHSCPTWFRQI